MPISTTGTSKAAFFAEPPVRTRLFFTLPEVIAVMAILLVLAAMAVPMLRSPSASSRMDETALEFQAFCGRVRYQAVERRVYARLRQRAAVHRSDVDILQREVALSRVRERRQRPVVKRFCALSRERAAALCLCERVAA